MSDDERLEARERGTDEHADEAQFLVQLERALEAHVRTGWLDHAGVDDDGRQLYRIADPGQVPVPSYHRRRPRPRGRR